MELSRLQMYRNKRKKRLKLLIKITIVFYLLIFSFSYLSGGTVAYFGAKGKEGITIAAGNWFDGSELVFTGKGNQNIKSCPEVEISVQIKNAGFKMIGQAKYEVYYVENGEPRIGGTMVENNGVIGPLNAGEETTLTFVASKDGFYEFKAYQRDGYEGKYSEIWSEKVKVKCIDNSSEQEKPESEVIEEIKENSKDEEKQNEIQEDVTDDTNTDEENTVNDSGETGTSQTEQDSKNQTDETEANPDEEDQDKTNSSEETNNVEIESEPTEEGETNEETD